MELSTTKIQPKDDIVSKLKAEAAKNKAFNAVCHRFALRERARQQVTIASLAATMKKEGYNFEKDQYGQVLAFLAALGLGTLDRNARGRIRSLRGIKMTLQSIGMAAIGNAIQLDKYIAQNRYTNLVSTPQVPQTIIETKPPVPPAPRTQKSMCKIIFTVTVDDKEVNFEVPGGVPKEELGQFIASLYPRKPRK